jgi:LysM repeat protein
VIAGKFLFAIIRLQFFLEKTEKITMLILRKHLPGLLFFLILTGLNAQTVYHTLQKGETLYSLSRTYGVSLQELMEINHISSPETLIEGVRLIIPGASSQENHQKSLEIDEKPDTAQYTVQKGDTFYRIAKNHGMGLDELMSLNNFSGNRILKPGDVLTVNGESVSRDSVVESAAPEERDTGGVVISSSSGVSWPVDGVKKTLTGKLRGVTIEAAEASLVQSVASGKVVWTGPYRGFGQVVLIDVNGYIYLYGGNEDIFVNVGEYVSAGARIGRLGNSGLASRTVNMYFSVFKDGIPVSVVSAPRG